MRGSGDELFSSGKAGPVECLGMTFENDDARREYFAHKLREKLTDPEFRRIPGFPEGSDEDILRMSDPPYYTACPNPFLEDFIRAYGMRFDPDQPYEREPFAVDVSVGKTDQLYRAHGYHTKVPHLAIVPSILHYTEPGDIVLDGFCGSGMTGIAAQWCGTAPAGYRRQLEEQWRKEGRGKPRWGGRRVILGDLSPAATFIAAGYNLPFDVEAFEKAAQIILDEVEEELGWMYETVHTDGKTMGRINYTVWSEVFSCPECAGEVVFIEEALDKETKRVRDEFPCPSCGVRLTKKKLDRLYETRFDAAIGETVKAPKRRPVLINYSVGRFKFEKPLDDADWAVLGRIEEMTLPLEAPALAAKAKGRWYVPDPGRQADVDKLRERTLLREFQEYKETKQRKLKLFRTEAVRAGFKAAYDAGDYRTIVEVAGRLPDKVLQEDEKLLMYYNVAAMRLGED